MNSVISTKTRFEHYQTWFNGRWTKGERFLINSLPNHKKLNFTFCHNAYCRGSVSSTRVSHLFCTFCQPDLVDERIFIRDRIYFINLILNPYWTLIYTSFIKHTNTTDCLSIYYMIKQNFTLNVPWVALLFGSINSFLG